MRTRLTIKSEFRRIFGYDESHRCRDCGHLVKVVNNRVYYKCEKMGVTMSAATDIRLKDVACRLWTEEEEDG